MLGLTSNKLGPFGYGLKNRDGNRPIVGPTNGNNGPADLNSGMGLNIGPNNLNDGTWMVGLYSKGGTSGQAQNKEVGRGVSIVESQDIKRILVGIYTGNQVIGNQDKIIKIVGIKNLLITKRERPSRAVHSMLNKWSNYTKCFLASNHQVKRTLAQRGNFLSALQSKSKIPWIIDLGASDHMTDSYHLFTIYSTCAGNLKVKIADRSLSSVAGKGSIKISDSITLEFVLHVSKLSCNLLFLSQLTKTSNCSAKFFPSYCVFQDLSSGKTIDSVKKKVTDSTTLTMLMWVNKVNLLFVILHLFLAIVIFCYGILEWVILTFSI